MPSFGDRGLGATSDLSPPIPSYAPTEPLGLGFPPPPLEDAPPIAHEPASPGQWTDGTTPAPAGRTRRSRGGGDDKANPRSEAGPRRLPLLLLLVLVLAGAAYLVWSQLLNGGDSSLSTAPPVSHPSATASVATLPGPLTGAALAASLKDPHFKHGYDWGKQRGSAPAAQREQTCRTEALKERGTGYPWGAHDRAGCLIALAG